MYYINILTKTIFLSHVDSLMGRINALKNLESYFKINYKF
jgi:hypothetical protein